MLKFFTGVSLKAWLILLCVVVAGWMAYSYDAAKTQVTDLKGTVKEQAVTIAVQQDHIQVDQVLDTIGEQTQVNTQAAVQAATQQHTTIQARAEQATREVVGRYDSQPLTLHNAEARQAELASINIDSLWAAYCAAEPAQPSCAPSER